MPYIAAVLAHQAFTTHFERDSARRPGLRVPLTADAALFAKVARSAARWCGCTPTASASPTRRRAVPPAHRALPRTRRLSIPRGGTIPGAPEPLPDEMTLRRREAPPPHRQGLHRQRAARGLAYEVSGMNVLHQWFSYRRRDRSSRYIGDRRQPSTLGDIQPAHWSHEYTSDLWTCSTSLVALSPWSRTRRRCSTRFLPADFSIMPFCPQRAHWPRSSSQRLLTWKTARGRRER